MTDAFPTSSPKTRIRQVIEHLLRPEDYKIAYLILSSGKESRLQVAIEESDGTPPTIDVCTRFHKQIRVHLITEGLANDTLKLEVSSPGLDRPLFTPEDFARFKGHTVKVLLRDPVDEHKRFEADIADVTGNTITFKSENGQVVTPLANINHCKLIPIL